MFPDHSHDALETSARPDRQAKSAVQKRSIVIGGHKTSVSLEDAFWSGLKEIARAGAKTLSDIVGEIDARRGHGNLSSAIRLFVLQHYRTPVAAVEAPSLPHHAAPRLAVSGEPAPFRDLLKG